MRRTILILAVAVATLAIPETALAHPLTGTSLIEVGKPATILIQIPAEGAAPMTGVDLLIPDGFDLTRPGPPKGWTAEVEPTVVRYRGPGVALGNVAVFNVGGTAPRAGRLEFPLVIHSADGESVEWGGTGGSRLPPIVVSALTELPDQDDGGGIDVGLWAGIGLVAVGVVAGVVLILRRRSDA